LTFRISSISSGIGGLAPSPGDPGIAAAAAAGAGGGGGGGGAGCFSLDSSVRMVNFCSKKISDLRRGELVLSIDSYGNIETTEVITIVHYGNVLGNCFL
jgi:hypothetical protein